MEEKSNGILTN